MNDCDEVIVWTNVPIAATQSINAATLTWAAQLGVKGRGDWHLDASKRVDVKYEAYLLRSQFVTHTINCRIPTTLNWILIPYYPSDEVLQVSDESVSNSLWAS